MAQTLPRPLSDLPALLGGRPAFDRRVPLVRPSVPNPEAVARDLRRVLDSRNLTNASYVRELELRTAEYLEVRHCIAVASCTAGLMLVLRAADLSGDVVVPSFTFAATVHAVAWNGLRPTFAEVDSATLTLQAEAARRAIGARTAAILAVHIYGTPCDVEGLTAVARDHGIRLFFDAAHAFGSRHGERAVGGFGDAEVFSLSPTKLLVAGEGGIIATNDDVLAERCRIGRDYGNPGDYDCLFVGLNARMSEIHAVLALHSLDGLEDRVGRRNALAGAYKQALATVSGIDFPQVPDADRSTYKDLTILVDPDRFGLDAGELAQALEAEGVETRRYYSPPVHAIKAYRHLNGVNGHLPVTEQVAAQVLTLPMWSDMTESDVAGIAEAVARIQTVAPRIRTVLQAEQSPGGRKATAD